MPKILQDGELRNRYGFKKKLDSKIILQIGKPLGVYETILQCHKSKKQTYHWGRFDLL